MLSYCSEDRCFYVGLCLACGSLMLFIERVIFSRGLMLEREVLLSEKVRVLLTEESERLQQEEEEGVHSFLG